MIALLTGVATGVGLTLAVISSFRRASRNIEDALAELDDDWMDLANYDDREPIPYRLRAVQ